MKTVIVLFLVYFGPSTLTPVQRLGEFLTAANCEVARDLLSASSESVTPMGWRATYVCVPGFEPLR